MILDAAEADAEVIELLKGGQKVAGRASEAVEFPDQHAIEIAVSRGRHQGAELGAPFAPAGDGNIQILSDDIEPGAFGVITKAVILRSGF